jgi:hypothetical protein
VCCCFSLERYGYGDRVRVGAGRGVLRARNLAVDDNGRRGCSGAGNSPPVDFHGTLRGQSEYRKYANTAAPLYIWRAGTAAVKANHHRGSGTGSHRGLSPATDVSLFPPSPSAARFAAQALSHPPRMAGSALAASPALHPYATQPSAGPRCGECAEIPDGPIQKRNLSGDAFVCYLQVVARPATANANSIRIFT